MRRIKQCVLISTIGSLAARALCELDERRERSKNPELQQSDADEAAMQAWMFIGAAAGPALVAGSSLTKLARRHPLRSLALGLLVGATSAMSVLRRRSMAPYRSEAQMAAERALADTRAVLAPHVSTWVPSSSDEPWGNR